MNTSAVSYKNHRFPRQIIARAVWLSGMVQLGISTVVFLAAASAAKAWTLAPNFWRLALVLILYSLGNLIMLRLIREFGMGVALSLSGAIQLLTVNLIAFWVFGEKVSAVQGAGLTLAVHAVALITIGLVSRGDE